MDSTDITVYQTCIKTLLSEYETLQTDWSCVETIFDDDQMRYIVLRLGWDDQRRIHVCLVHIDIQDDMIVIQANNTEAALDDELVALGVPREKICPGILPPNVREQLKQHERQKNAHTPQPHVHNQLMPQTA
jgi:hypothetical protein